MELVYLWISKYKNIENQGFNLNSKWQVEYNDQTKELKVQERNPQPIPNFFGENISNVTAIVGENGAGKSTLLELLVILTTFNKNNYNIYDCEFIYLTLIDKKINILSNIINNIQYDTVLIYKDIRYNDFITQKAQIKSMYYSNIFQPIRVFQNTDVFLDDRNYGMLIDISTNGYFYKEEGAYEINDFERFIKFFDSINKNQEKKATFNKLGISIPTHIVLSAKDNNNFINDKLDNKSKEILNTISSILDENSNRKIIGKFKDFLFLKYFVTCFANILNNMTDDTHRLFLFIIKNNAYTIIKDSNFIINFIENIKRNIIDKLNALTTEINGHESPWLEETELKILESIQGYGRVFFEPSKLKNRFEKIDFFEKEIEKHFDVDETKYIIPISVFTENIENIGILKTSTFFSSYTSNTGDIVKKIELFKHSWLNKDASQKEFHFSFGELSIISLFSRLVCGECCCENINILFLDEADLGLHPDWQTRFFNILLENIKISHFKNLHIILTTHSPFVLSDLPRENVVFLEKDKAGKCQVVKNPMERPQTFASNIHTLFAEGFFMREGTIGHFAKSKISYILEILNSTSKDIGENTKQQILQIIDLIGEPIIKNKLLVMFDEKFGVDEKIKRLQAEIDYLNKLKNK
jgi:predicted ATPase